MKPADDIHKLIKKLHLKASAKLDRRVHDDISRALAKSEKHVLSEVEGTESVRSEPNLWRSIMRGGVVKIAVAAAILIAFGIGFSVGRWSKPTRPARYSLDVTGYTSAISVYPTVPKAEDSFWRQKALAAVQPKPYIQNQFTKTNLIDAYKQYIKGKYYD
jgi:hypothetical protein